jgi:hypothetical protein
VTSSRVKSVTIVQIPKCCSVGLLVLLPSGECGGLAWGCLCFRCKLVANWLLSSCFMPPTVLKVHSVPQPPTHL